PACARGSKGARDVMVGGPVGGQPFATPGEPMLRWRSRAHSIEEVEGELARIWAETHLEVDRHQDEVHDSAERHVAARTSVMTLVGIPRRPEVGERCAAIIQALT